jgi:hypothetical protein
MRHRRPSRIVYDADDSARANWPNAWSASESILARAALQRALAQALRRGNESAYILSLIVALLIRVVNTGADE